MTDLFHGRRAFSQRELDEILEMHKTNRNREFSIDLQLDNRKLGCKVDPQVRRMMNEYCENLSTLAYRLIETIKEMREVDRGVVKTLSPFNYICMSNLGVMVNNGEGYESLSV